VANLGTLTRHDVLSLLQEVQSSGTLPGEDGLRTTHSR